MSLSKLHYKYKAGAKTPAERKKDMIKITVVLHKENEKVKTIAKYVRGNAWDINESIYNTLTAWGIDEEIAIDCASWGELAGIGESYNIDDFDLYIDDEE